MVKEKKKLESNRKKTVFEKDESLQETKLLLFENLVEKCGKVIAEFTEEFINQFSTKTVERSIDEEKTKMTTEMPFNQTNKTTSKVL